MLRNVVTTFFIFLFSINVFASDTQSEDYQLYQNNPGAYYATHPAVTDNLGTHVEVLSKFVWLKISSYLDTKSASQLLRAIWPTQLGTLGHGMGILQLPNMYMARGKNIDDVFLKFNHPAWTPSILPPKVNLDFHLWYLKASDLSSRLSLLSAQEEDLPEEIGEGLRSAFLLYYSAGCMGHMLAAEEAGAMLCNPLFNEYLPVIPTYADLQPLAQEWDIKRLNQPQTNNLDLNNLLLQIENTLKTTLNEDELDEKDIPSIIEVLGHILNQIDALKEQSEEVFIVKSFIKEFQESLVSGESRDLFKPVKTSQLAKHSKSPSSLIKHFSLLCEEDYTPQLLKGLEEIVAQTLNHSFVDALSDQLEQFIYTITEADETEDVDYHMTPKYTPEAQEALKWCIQLQRVCVFLGGDSSFHPINLCTDPHDVEQLESLQGIINTESGNAVTVFMTHLMLTRTPISELYEDLARNNVRYILSPLGNGDSGNPERLELLDREFDYTSDE